MFFSSSTDDVLQQKLSEGRGKCIEADTPVTYVHEVQKRGKESLLQACSSPNNNRCTGNNSVLLRVNNRDTSDIF